MRRPLLTDAYIENVLRTAGDNLFRQHNHSLGYLLSGKNAIAEANVILQLASAFVAHGHAVWAESPFKEDGENACKRLDLLVDLSPEATETATVLLIEANRLTSVEKKTKLEEIIDDYERLRTWPDRAVGQTPMFFDLYMQVERAVSVLVVMIPDEAAVRAVLPDQPTFSEWWQTLSAQPPGYDTSRIEELKRIIAPMKRGVLRSPFSDGGTRLTMVYALLGRELTVVARKHH